MEAKRASKKLDPGLVKLQEVALAYRRKPTDDGRDLLAELALPVAQRIARKAWERLAAHDGVSVSMIDPDSPAGQAVFEVVNGWLRPGRKDAAFPVRLTVRVKSRVVDEYRAMA